MLAKFQLKILNRGCHSDNVMVKIILKWKFCVSGHGPAAGSYGHVQGTSVPSKSR